MIRRLTEVKSETIIILLWLVWCVWLLWLMFTPAQAQSFSTPPQQWPGDTGKSTNPPNIRKWFVDLRSHQGGQCCGEADGYPAEVTHNPDASKDTYTYNGVATIIDPSEKEIWVNGNLIKKRPALTGNLTINFSYRLTTLEQQGNPFTHAFVFLRANDDGTIGYVFCVVPLAPMG